MSPRCPTLPGTLTPFLYPFFITHTPRSTTRLSQKSFSTCQRRCENSLYEKLAIEKAQSFEEEIIENPLARLNPPPSDYGRSIFADKATITVHAGAGGHGCISFLREKYISEGPANGGDGGYGGSVYIQAVRGETSLHKLARRSVLKAGRGRNGQGRTKGGERGDDIVIQVPVGTVVRETERTDPVAIEELKLRYEAPLPGEDAEGREVDVQGNLNGPYKWDKQKWLLYPAITKEDIANAEFPSFPRARRSHLHSAQERGPVKLDLSRPMEKPILLAAGAVGGLGNPHFVTKTAPRPKFATKGEDGMRITLSLELKLLADVGLVGLPNAGKSTLLRAVTNSRARVGSWAFTTLQPNIGTVVLDDHTGRPGQMPTYETGEIRTNFTIADIPGLVEGAHLDRGLGISFLRHVERARVLAFVIDLNAGDAVAALKALWKEVGEYERMKLAPTPLELAEEDEKKAKVAWSPLKDESAVPEPVGTSYHHTHPEIPDKAAGSIAKKPWFVVATKADLPGTKERYEELKAYIKRVESGEEEHPSGQPEGWVKSLEAIPISAINGHGVERIKDWTIGLLGEYSAE
jgi:GTP-binding protein